MSIIVDYETRPILSGSGLAPVPVGVSILQPGMDNVYLAWGHPGANNSTYEFARRALASVWDKPLVFHNCKFDIGVAIEHMGLPWPKHYDDTMFQAYLVDPLANKLGLKNLAQRWLKMDPEERDAVFLWLKDNFTGPFLDDHKMITVTNAGAYIGYAPYEVVAPYAMGDTLRTRGLHELLLPKVHERGMSDAYERELKIARIGYEMERVGVRVDRASLERDCLKYSALRSEADDVVSAYLGDIDLDKPAQIAQALLERGYADDLPKTPTGRLSTAKDSIEGNVKEPVLAQAIRYRGALHTTGNYFKQWLQFSERDGHVHPSWNQTRSEKGGARTGRFSCSEPNLTNVSNENEEVALEGLDMPFMRQYILPDEGQIIIPSDFNGQEMRILAHYAEGRMAEVYRTDPTADFHSVASALIKQYAHMTVPRKLCKIVGFSLIYGSGVATLARQMGVSEEVARKIKYAYFKAFPGLQEFINIFRSKREVKTWGGRWLPTEPPHEVDGEWREFYYKLCNYLIQGSAADQSKEAMVRYDANKQHGRLLMMVHDELVISAPADYARIEVPLLTEAMEGMPGWDVPFRVEVESGVNWYNLEKFQ